MEKSLKGEGCELRVLSRFKNKDIHSGFSLLEMAVVIMIVGVLTSALLAALQTRLQRERIKTTRDKIIAIDEALRQFASINFRLPCPSSRSVAQETNAFGVESTGCDGGPHTDASIARDPGGPPANRVAIGAVPVKALGLTDEYAFDSWGRRILYAVTEAEARTLVGAPPAPVGPANPAVVANGGRISLLYPGAAPPFTTVAPYVVLSHGDDGKGGWTQGGVLSAVACAGPAQDVENCNDDITFRYSARYSRTGAAAASHYDDYMAYGPNNLGMTAGGSASGGTTGGCIVRTWMPARTLERWGDGCLPDNSGLVALQCSLAAAAGYECGAVNFEFVSGTGYVAFYCLCARN